MCQIKSNVKMGVFPTNEKLGKVTPIYKTGERSSFDKYRSIYVLNVLSKILENIFCKQISAFLESNNLIYKQHYGFRKNKGTQDAVIYLHDHIRQNMDKWNLTGALLIDLHKAFNSVSQSFLPCKLPYYGMYGNEKKWKADYLFH